MARRSPTRDEVRSAATLLTGMLRHHPQVVGVEVTGSMLLGYNVTIILTEEGGGWPKYVDDVPVKTRLND